MPRTYLDRGSGKTDSGSFFVVSACEVWRADPLDSDGCLAPPWVAFGRLLAIAVICGVNPSVASDLDRARFERASLSKY